MVLWESGKTVHGFVRAFSRKIASVFFFLLRSQIFGDRFVGTIISFISPANAVRKITFVAHSCSSGVR